LEASAPLAMANTVAGAIGNAMPVAGAVVVGTVAVGTNAIQRKLHADIKKELANFQVCVDHMQDCHIVTQNLVRTVCLSYRKNDGAKFSSADHSSTASNTPVMTLLNGWLAKAGLTFKHELFASPQGLAASNDAALLINALTELDDAGREEFRGFDLYDKTNYLAQKLGVSANQIDTANSPRYAIASPNLKAALSSAPSQPDTSQMFEMMQAMAKRMDEMGEKLATQHSEKTAMQRRLDAIEVENKKLKNMLRTPSAPPVPRSGVDHDIEVGNQRLQQRRSQIQSTEASQTTSKYASSFVQLQTQHSSMATDISLLAEVSGVVLPSNANQQKDSRQEAA